MMYLARRLQQADVIPIEQDTAAASSDTVHGACEAGRNGLHPAGERVAITRFHDQMRVVVLK